MSTNRGCKSNPDVFCYISGEFTKVSNKTKIDDLVDNLYHAYFEMKIGDQDKPWTPYIVCSTCIEHLRQWKSGKRNLLKFGEPIIWREPQNHHDDCYFCVFDVVGLNKRTKKSNKFGYPGSKSTIRSVATSDYIPVPVLKESG